MSAQGLLSVVRTQFNKINAPYDSALRSKQITQTDCLMSAVAMFSLKFPSLLKFDENRGEENIKHNLRTLYGIQKTPCDTYMRERCDEANPDEVRKIYKSILACVQRGKALEEFSYLDNHYLLAGDGTSFFTSHNTHCANCCIRHHNKCHIKFILNLPENTSHFKKNTYLLVKNPKQPWEIYYINNDKQKIKIDINNVIGLKEILLDKSRKNLSLSEKELIKGRVSVYYRIEHPEEQITYYHNMFCAAIVHPEKKIVLPFAPEAIMKADGASKNDHERNASRRLYADARREHPHMKFIVVEDALASNVPHLADLKSLNMRYITGVKPGDHKFLFDLVKRSQCSEYSHQTDDGKTHRYRYINQVQLNNSHDFKVNFLEYWEADKNGEVQHFSWVTDFVITDENVYHLMKGGRVNWRIENNTFNTLKNQDYHFSHNFGHGYKNLSTVFGMLMMLAFLIDQVQELCCHLFKKARAKFKSRTSLWERIKSLFTTFLIKCWDDLFNAIAFGTGAVLNPNTS